MYKNWGVCVFRNFVGFGFTSEWDSSCFSAVCLYNTSVASRISHGLEGGPHDPTDRKSNNSDSPPFLSARYCFKCCTR